MQRAFQIDPRDNVVTALEALRPGEVEILGECSLPRLSACEEIPDGHKMAIRHIMAGEKIVKYGVVIGEATREIGSGSWVHLHCMKSLYDERSSHLDVHTGAPLDTKYE